MTSFDGRSKLQRMARYRSKPVFVEAFQWKSGDVIEGVIPHDARIRYSDDRKLFYIEKNNLRSSFWMSVDKSPGEATDAQKKAGFMEPSTAQYKLKTGEVYCRTLLHFSTWKVPARLHIDEPIDESSDLFLDYGSSSGWTEATAIGPAISAYMKKPDGSRLCFKSGDWVITDDKGRRSTMSDEAFRAEYDCVEGGFITEDEVTP